MNTALLPCTNPGAALHYGRKASWFVAGAAALLVANANAATAVGGDGLDEAAALRTSQAAIGRMLGEHLLTDQDGQPLRLSGLRGRPLVLHLIYTNCYQVCSGLTVHLRDVVRIARTALGADSFAVLTVGFDPEHDSPARLREYGRERGLLSPQWRLASADAFTVRRLADEVGFTWTVTPAGFDHIAQITIIDAAGRVVEQVYGQDFAPPALVDPLRQLAWRGAVQRSDLRGILDGVKLLCTVYDPVSGRYRFDYAMLAGILPAVLVLGMAAVAILMASRKTR